MYLTEVRLDDGNFVTLDGLGNIRNASGEKTAYTYVYLTTYSYVPYLVVVKDGVKSLATITKEGNINVLTLNDFEEWTLNGTNKKYIFVGGKDTGSLWLVDGDNYVREYYYESDSQYDVLFYLTDMDEKDYKMTLNKKDNTFKLEELKDEN